MPLDNGSEKKYGLIIPNIKPKEELKQPNKSVFAEDSDNDGEEEEKFRHPNFDVKLETLKASLKKTTKINIEKAMKEDSSIFLYDEVYDEMNKQKDQKVLDKCKPGARKPKYVENLLKVSAVRKLEHELLSERKAQRELEAEKDQFADKESFVTGAYKEKMSEIRQLVEQRKKEEEREKVMDVTKQDGLGGFYRYMFQKTTAIDDCVPVKVANEQDTELAKDTLKSAVFESVTLETNEKVHKLALPLENQEFRKLSHERTSDRVRRYSKSPISRKREDRDDRSHRHSHHSHHFRRDNRCDNYDRHKNHPPHNQQSQSSHYRKEIKSVSDHHSRNNRELKSKDYHSKHFKSPKYKSSSQRDLQESSRKTKESVREKTPPGFIRCKPTKISNEELTRARERYLIRKKAGIKADIVDSDDEI